MGKFSKILASSNPHLPCTTKLGAKNPPGGEATLVLRGVATQSSAVTGSANIEGSVRRRYRASRVPTWPSHQATAAPCVA